MSGSEFDIIAKHFRPLTGEDTGALSLQDDAALLSVPPSRELVVTTDAVVAGVHFLDSLSPEDVAYKVVGVNLSDLAAMGAEPQAVFLAAQFPKDLSEDWIAAFAGGLKAALAPSGAKLLGGDTVSTPGPVALSLTALGQIARGRALRRAGAKPGDIVFVTGAIGDGALGLLLLQSGIDGLSDAHRAHLARRYARPEPRWKFAMALAQSGLVTAAIDISDGLVADVGHICTASGVEAVIEAEQVPVSEAGHHALVADPGLLQSVLSGGDDYELAFTAPEDAVADIENLAEQQDLDVAAIGRIETPGKLEISPGTGPVIVLDTHGAPLDVGAGGYQHL